MLETFASQPCLCIARVELVSWKPRAFVYHNFLSPEECEHIMQEASPMVRSRPSHAVMKASSQYTMQLRFRPDSMLTMPAGTGCMM